ncbi:right-handed parallel beta-helix repeat-containing protein [Chitinophagaceae bacterium LB-8]|uniref:Right-handed parallel beta-helix repeat-containing protein n=1 Tax=Paraflavisolibacter caeni TaxID=2982496 RepID=A0A9X2Y096_9BACT|nr:right-handed parallel beta-helix repeat-containing protein [Paraflavisolibacter caeni]MCU7552211.1 right-handed parallel beta-helix repeat-containing protein [Paraflavisolibacter caeni]
MKIQHLLLACLGLVGLQTGAFAQKIINAADFGVKANSPKDAGPGIRKAIEACKKTGKAILVLPGGRIDIWPDNAVKRELYISNSTENDTLPKIKSIAFPFEGCNNITLDGNNTLVVLHGKMVSFAILNSVNMKVKNIRFDYERPTISELTIKSVSDTAIETVIHQDSKYAIDSGRISFYGEGWKVRNYHTIVFDPSREIMRYSNFAPFLASKAVETTPFQVRFEGKFAKTNFRPGDVLTFRDPYRDNCGAFISRSRNIELENVKMYFMHGLGIVSQFSENISLLKVAVAPRENSGRIISSFADCFHFSGCRGLVKIDSCLTSGSHDDPVNVHGTHLQITAIDEAKKIKVRFMHNQTYGFEAFFAGDSIAFINPKTLMPLGKAKLKAAKLLNRREMELEVVGELPSFASTGLCIENLTWTPEVVIRNSRFERTNTRGLLLTTSRKVIIENNVFHRTGMYPILIADDASSWFESGSVQDVTIRYNTFEDCGNNSGGAINIAPENHELMAGNFVHRNIRIIDNTFKVYKDAVLSARSVDNLEFSGNKIMFTNFLGSGNSKPSINLTACKNVVINKNSFDAAGQPVIITSKMTEKDLKTDLDVKLMN